MAQHGVIYNIPSEICQKISRKIDDSAKRSDDDGATTAARSKKVAIQYQVCHFPSTKGPDTVRSLSAGQRDHREK